MTTVYIISAPSGSGKSTLVDVLRKQVEGLKFSISYTTRPPRGSEQNGREYFFVPRAEFEGMIRQNELIKQKIPDAASIFVLPPNREQLEWRLRNRGLDSEQVIRRRLDTARREIENYDKYDYILVNDRLEESVDRLKAIVLSERLRRSGCTMSPEDQAKLAIAEQCRLNNIRDRVQPILDSFRDGQGQGQKQAAGEFL